MNSPLPASNAPSALGAPSEPPAPATSAPAGAGGDHPPPALEIAVAALLRPAPGATADSAPTDAVEVLIARRPQRAIAGGLWELPGGKVGAGEELRVAAARELLEETGIRVEASCGCVVGRVCARELTPRTDPLISPRSPESPRSPLVLTLVVFAAPAHATPQPLASTECRWEQVSRLESYEWPPANAALNAMLRDAAPAWRSALVPLHPVPPPA